MSCSESRPARYRAALAVALGALAATACVSDAELRARQAPPPLAPVEDPRTLYGQQTPILPLPQAPAETGPVGAGSLFVSARPSLFSDRRAHQIGDIITVQIQVDDSATVNNSTSRQRDATEDNNINGFFGLENALGAIFPGGFDPAIAVDVTSSGSSSGTGSVDRQEQINLTVAALVTEVLANGNLLIAGRQEMRINHEIRDLTITGIVRPNDVTSDNTIQHTQIAEARIAYGGRGVISDVQRPRYGQEKFDLIYPF